MKSNPVVHFEMPYENSERLAKFYSQAFGWQCKRWVVTWAIMLRQPQQKQMKQNGEHPGTINGGFFPKTQEHLHSPQW